MSAPDDWCPACEGTAVELIEGGGTNPCPFGCTPPKPIQAPSTEAQLAAKIEQMRAIRAERVEA